jgi:hypothetical protein
MWCLESSDYEDLRLWTWFFELKTTIVHIYLTQFILKNNIISSSIKPCMRLSWLYCRRRFIHFPGSCLKLKHLKSLHKPLAEDNCRHKIDFGENRIILYIIQICYIWLNIISYTWPLLFRRDIIKHVQFSNF